MPLGRIWANICAADVSQGTYLYHLVSYLWYHRHANGIIIRDVTGQLLSGFGQHVLVRAVCQKSQSAA